MHYGALLRTMTLMTSAEKHEPRRHRHKTPLTGKEEQRGAAFIVFVPRWALKFDQRATVEPFPPEHAMLAHLALAALIALAHGAANIDAVHALANCPTASSGNPGSGAPIPDSDTLPGFCSDAECAICGELCYDCSGLGLSSISCNISASTRLLVLSHNSFYSSLAPDSLASYTNLMFL